MVRRFAVLACLGLAFAAVPQAGAADKIGFTYGSSGGTGCIYGGTHIQTQSAGNQYAAPYDGVITSWANAGSRWHTVTFKVARLGSGSNYTVTASDGPRTAAGLTSYPVRFPVRQGDVIGGYIPTANYSSCLAVQSAGDMYGLDDENPLANGSGFFDSTASGTVPIEAMIERDRDNDGYGDESQDGCPTNASTAGPCPLPTVLGQTFTPNTQVGSGTSIPALPADQRFSAPADGVITSWSYAANTLVDGTAKLKAVRPLGGDGFQVVAESETRTPVASTLNIFPTRLSVRAGDRIGIRTNNLPSISNVSASGSSWYATSDPDPAPGTSATFTPSNRRVDVSAVLEADADADGYGDTSQDLCPTDPSTQGQCRAVEPPGDGKCAKARNALEKAKAKLKKLKKNDAAKQKVRKAKQKVMSAKADVKEEC